MADDDLKQLGFDMSLRGVGRFLNSVARVNTELSKLGKGAGKRFTEASVALNQYSKDAIRAVESTAKLGEARVKAAAQVEKSAGQIAAAGATEAKAMAKTEVSINQLKATQIAAAARIRAEELKVEQARIRHAATTESAYDRIVKATQRMVKSLVQAPFQIPIKGFSLMTKGAMTLGKGIISLVTSPFRMLSNFLTGPLSIAGLAFTGLTWRIGMAVRNLGNDVLEALESFQRLEIQLEALTARDLAKELGIPVAEAFEMATYRAKELTRWIKRVALETPFTLQSVGNTLALANAFGLTIEQAKELTLAVGNFTSAMGLTEDHMFRIIYNFGQMQQQGKLTGREFRDLAISFVPVFDILERMGVAADMTKEEMKELALSGGVPVQDFFDEFIKMAQEDFPGAMERMAGTFRGLTNRFKDFIQIALGIELLGPVFAEVTATINERMKDLLSEESIIRFTILGQVLRDVYFDIKAGVDAFTEAVGNVLAALGITKPTLEDIIKTLYKFGAVFKAIAQTIAEFVNRYIVPAIEGISGLFEDVFGGLVGDAGAWGSNIITQFAYGIINAVGTVLTWAVNVVAGFIEGWFGPGSPPRVAPLMVEWGINTMAEFLRGFTLADFDALDSVQKALRGSLQALVAMGEIAKEDLGGIFAEVSVELIEALDEFNKTGQISEGIFDKLRLVGGEFGDELARLLELQIDLSAAMEAAEQAQERLNAAIKAAEEARGAVHNLTREYNALLRAGADPAILEQKLAELNAVEKGRYLAEQEQDAAEGAAEAAEEALDPLREQVKLQERLIEQLIELVKMQFDLGGGGGGGGGGEPEPPEEPELPGGGGLIGGIEESFRSMLDRLRQAALDELSTLWEDIGAIWDSTFGDALSKLQALWQPFIDDISAKWQTILSNLRTFWEQHGEPIMDTIRNTVSTVLSNLAKIAGNLASTFMDLLVDWSDWLVENGGLVEEFVAFVGDLVVRFSALGVVISEKLDAPLKAVNEVIQTLVFWIMTIATSDWFGKMIDLFFELAEALVEITSETITNGLESINRAIDGLGMTIDNSGPAILGIFSELTDLVNDAFGTVASFVNLLISSVSLIINTGALISGVFSNILDHKPPLEGLGGTIKNIQAETAQWYAALFDTGAYFVETLIPKALEGEENWSSQTHDLADAMYGFSDAIDHASDRTDNLSYVTGGTAEHSTIHFTDVGSASSDMSDDISDATDDITADLDEIVSAQAGLALDWSGDADTIISSTSDASDEIGYSTEEVLQSLADMGDGSGDMHDKLVLDWAGIADNNTGLAKAAELIDVSAEDINEAMDNIEEGVGDMDDYWLLKMAEVATTTETEKDRIYDAMEALATDLIGQSLIPEMFDDITAEFTTRLGTDVVNIADTETNNIIAVIAGKVPDFFNAGADIIQGLIDGIVSKIQAAIETVRGLINSIINAAKEVADIVSPSKVMDDIGQNMVKGLIQGVENQAGNLLSTIREVIGGAIEETEDLFDLSGVIGGFGRSVVRRLQDEIRTSEEREAEIQAQFDEGNLSLLEQMLLYQELTELQQERLKNEQAIAEFQEKQQQLQFLRDQWQLITDLQEAGLDPGTVLQGIELGLDANLDDLLAAMTAAIQAIIEQTEEELGSGSPSMVFMGIGEDIMEGLTRGLVSSAGSAIGAAQLVTQTVAAPVVSGGTSVSFGDTHINNGMDEALFRERVLRVVGGL